jgi:hypothetical protein
MSKPLPSTRQLIDSWPVARAALAFNDLAEVAHALLCICLSPTCNETTSTVGSQMFADLAHLAHRIDPTLGDDDREPIWIPR